ncbi:MAG: hypothetical protein ABI790_16075 [Betaproteobacteria bacterium]
MTITHRTGKLHVTLQQCINLLEARRQLLCEQINDYARPVAACDADFNALLAERDGIAQALSHLRPICRGETRVPHPREERSFH